jgi:hypothetical protein
MYMGVGIAGGIPIRLYFTDSFRRKNFLNEPYSEDFLKFYREEEPRNDNKFFYTLDYPELLPQFKEYYFGFYSILQNERMLKETISFSSEYDDIIKRNDIDAFIEYFEKANERYSTIPEPRIFGDGYLSTLYFEPACYLNIYSGSYKAYLEVYSTLDDMRKLLIKAYDHPLAKITVFGMLG